MMGSATASGDDRAREAAHTAISSPLLEDIDINGARGILVNVTAGMDMAIGEFEEVGEVIREFASDEATVVIGTVLDPEMKGDLRVTMVATGISVGTPREKPVVVHKGTQPTNYRDLDTPTVIRGVPRRRVQSSATVQEKDIDYLDIPAFLRRQAD
jgi:cell division protein FtsZ